MMHSDYPKTEKNFSLFIITYILVIAVLAFMLTTLNSCSDDPEVSPILTNGRANLNNDEESLNQRLVSKQDTITITDVENPGGKKKPSFDLILVNEIESPEIGGDKLQATSVFISNGRALVGYNFRGELYRGAVELLTASPSVNLKSQILFDDADIHHIEMTESQIFLATGTSNLVDGQSAVLEIYPLSGNKMDLSGSKRIALGSYAANSVSSYENQLFVTTGDDESQGGGLYMISERSYEIEKFIPLHDARWSYISDQSLFILQGTPGIMGKYDAGSLSGNETVIFNGADIPEAKSTLEIHGYYAFIAAGSAGVQIINIVTGKSAGEIPLPSGTSGQIILTNAVSYDEGLIFISNGEGGVYVAEALTPVDKNMAEFNTTLLGHLEFDDLPSVNHVAFKSNYLYIAAGEGGVKVVKVAY